MYYKITNPSPVYSPLRAIRENELRIEAANRKQVGNALGFPLGRFVGRRGQATFHRVTEYFAFEFPENHIPDPKAWRPVKQYPGCYAPNRRSKEGKRIALLLSSLEHSVTPWGIWELVQTGEPNGNFDFPLLFLCGDTLLLYLDDQQTPTVSGIVEITRSEFHTILDIHPEQK